MVFLAFLIFLPFIEIAGFVAIGSEIGVLNTIFLYIAAAAAGMVMIQREGLRTLMDIQGAMDSGEMPVREMFDGMCVFLAGLFLLLPGFVSDIAAFLLLIPLVRNFLRRYAARYFIGEPLYSGWRQSTTSDIIDAEFSRVDDDEPKKLN